MNALRHKVIFAATLWLLALAAHIDASGEMPRLRLDDRMTPASAEVIVSAIARAGRDGAAALIIMLNTPGGLETSMREIASRIIAPPVSVIVYVAPSGSRAASAGFVILLSADIAAMAPGTATGAAHPVLIGGGEMSKTMTEKIVNDAPAYVRSLAEKRNRDPQVAESAIRESRSFTDREALDERLIEIIARDEWNLLAQANGRTVIRFDGSQKVLQTANEKYQAAEKLVSAAHTIASKPTALQLRYLQTLTEIGVERNTTVVFPLPIDLFERLFDRKETLETVAPQQREPVGTL